MKKVTPANSTVRVEKPLPSPPIIQVLDDNTLTKEGRTLLDACEKPLKRSPPGKPNEQEEWPSLAPMKTYRQGWPDNDRDIGHQTPASSASRIPIKAADPRLSSRADADTKTPRFPNVLKKEIYPKVRRTPASSSPSDSGISYTRTRPSTHRELAQTHHPAAMGRPKDQNSKPGPRDRLRVMTESSPRNLTMEQIHDQVSFSTSGETTRSFSEVSPLLRRKGRNSLQPAKLDLTCDTGLRHQPAKKPHYGIIERDNRALLLDPARNIELESEHESLTRASKLPRAASAAVALVEPILSTADVDVFSDGRVSPSLPLSSGLHVFPFDKADSNTIAVDQEAFKIKRLSSTFPEHGPTLRISASAEKIIMGSSPTRLEKSRSLLSLSNISRPTFRIITNHQHRQPGSLKQVEAIRSRPVSSQALLSTPDRSRQSLGPAGTYTLKKATSVEVLRTPPPKHSVLGTDLSCDLKRDQFRRAESFLDPFQCKQEAVRSGSPRLTFSLQKGHANCLTPLSEGAWLSPIRPRSVSSPSTPMYLAKSRVVIATVSDDKARGTHGERRFLDSTPIDPDRSPSTNFSPLYPPRTSSRTPVSQLGSDVSTGKVKPGLNETAYNPFLAAEFDKDKPNSVSKITTTEHELHEHVPTDVSKLKPQNSLSRGVLSNFRGLFHRSRKTDNGLEKRLSSQEGKETKMVKYRNSTLKAVPPNMSNPAPTSIGEKALKPLQSPQTIATPSTTASESPLSLADLAGSTNLGMALLSSAQKAQDKNTRDHLFQLGKMVVEAITQAHEAEKAMEEAKHAARQAELSYTKCVQSVLDATHKIIGDGSKF
ncbi:hypothetical protein MMC25_003285 [Agyrium rufum]|nr:hypothetical protein [Agyrium rufum]